MDTAAVISPSSKNTTDNIHLAATATAKEGNTHDTDTHAPPVSLAEIESLIASDKAVSMSSFLPSRRETDP